MSTLDVISVGMSQDATRAEAIVRACGSRLAVTTAADVWAGTAGLRSPTFAEGIPSIVSSSANDTAAGSGARTVRVQSADATGALQSEDVVLAGATPVALTKSAVRIVDVSVLTAGSSSGNVGTLTVTIAAGEQAVVPIGRGSSSACVLFVPAARRVVVLSARAQASLVARAQLISRPVLSTLAAETVLAEGYGANVELVHRALVVDGPVELIVRASASVAADVGATIEAIQDSR